MATKKIMYFVSCFLIIGILSGCSMDFSGGIGEQSALEHFVSNMLK